MMNYEQLGCRLKERRIRLRYKQEYLAEKIGVQQRYISKIEQGLAKPEFAKIYDLANVLGVSLDYLMSDEKEISPDYLTDTIMIRLQLLSKEEKKILLDALEYYIRNIKDGKAMTK